MGYVLCEEKTRFTENSLARMLKMHIQNHKYGSKSILDAKHPNLADRQLNACYCTGVTLGPPPGGRGGTPLLTWVITWTPWEQGCFHCQILLKQNSLNWGNLINICCSRECISLPPVTAVPQSLLPLPVSLYPPFSSGPSKSLNTLLRSLLHLLFLWAEPGLKQMKYFYWVYVYF